MQIKHQFDLWGYNSSTDPLVFLESDFKNNWPVLLEAKRIGPHFIRIITADTPRLRFWNALRAIRGIGGVINASSYLRDIDVRLYEVDKVSKLQPGDLIIVKSFKSAFLLRSGLFTGAEEDSLHCNMVIEGRIQKLVFKAHEIQKLREL